MTTDTREARIQMYSTYHTIKPKRARKERKTEKTTTSDGDGPHNHLNCHVLHEVPGIRTLSPAACIPLLVLYVLLSLHMGIVLFLVTAPCHDELRPLQL
jgi:hypothetical protein